MSIILDKVNYTYSEGTAYEIHALKDINLKLEVEETGKNAIENAYLKAKAYYEATGITTIVSNRRTASSIRTICQCRRQSTRHALHNKRAIL